MTRYQGISQFYLHTHTFVRNRNEPYLPLPFQLQLVLIYRPRRDGRLSRPWCEVAQAEIQTCNLPIANLVLYQTATHAPSAGVLVLSHVGLSILSPTVELIMNVISGVCTTCLSRVTHKVVDAVWMLGFVIYHARKNLNIWMDECMSIWMTCLGGSVG